MSSTKRQLYVTKKPGSDCLRGLSILDHRNRSPASSQNGRIAHLYLVFTCLTLIYNNVLVYLYTLFAISPAKQRAFCVKFCFAQLTLQICRLAQERQLLMSNSLILAALLKQNQTRFLLCYTTNQTLQTWYIIAGN